MRGRTIASADLRSFLGFVFSRAHRMPLAVRCPRWPAGVGRHAAPWASSPPAGDGAARSCDRRRDGGGTTPSWCCSSGSDCGRSRSAPCAWSDIDWRAGEIAGAGQGGRLERLPLARRRGRGDRRLLAQGTTQPLPSGEVFLSTVAPSVDLRARAWRGGPCTRANVPGSAASVPTGCATRPPPRCCARGVAVRGGPGPAAPKHRHATADLRQGRPPRPGELAMPWPGVVDDDRTSRAARGLPGHAAGDGIQAGMDGRLLDSSLSTSTRWRRSTSASPMRRVVGQAAGGCRDGMVDGQARHPSSVRPLPGGPRSGDRDPTGGSSAEPSHRIVPYIYSDEDIEGPDRGGRPTSQDTPGRHLPTLIGLLAVTGMCVGRRPPRSADVDLDQGLLTIRNSKFGKSRQCSCIRAASRPSPPTHSDVTRDVREPSRRASSLRRPGHACCATT